MDDTRVSVVIPTIGRIESLKAAIMSVLQQTYPVCEIIIVVDGFCEEVVDLCKNFITETTIKVFQTGERKGGAYARNFGISKSTGYWVALLDDDDIWVSTKLSIQLKTVRKWHNDFPHLLSFTKVKVISNNKQYYLPRRKLKISEQVADYLFIPSLGRTQGFIQSSTFLAPRKTLLSYPFDIRLNKHQDWDLVINLDRANIKLVYVDVPLTIYSHNTNGSVGRANRWQESLRWIHSKKDMISKDAFQNFIIDIPMKGVLKDDLLGYKEIVLYYKDMSKLIKLKNKFSIKYWRNQLYLLQISIKLRNKG